MASYHTSNKIQTPNHGPHVTRAPVSQCNLSSYSKSASLAFSLIPAQVSSPLRSPCQCHFQREVLSTTAESKSHCYPLFFLPSVGNSNNSSFSVSFFPARISPERVRPCLCSLLGGIQNMTRSASKCPVKGTRFLKLFFKNSHVRQKTYISSISSRAKIILGCLTNYQYQYHGAMMVCHRKAKCQVQCPLRVIMQETGFQGSR